MERSSYLRVTDILAPLSGIDRVPKLILEAAAARGTLVHSCVNWYINEGDWVGVTDEVAPYVESFKAWYDAGEMKIITTEERYYDDELCVTGQMDLIYKDKDGKVCLVDFKTSSKPQCSWPLQLSAYKHLTALKGLQIDLIQVVHLKKDGSAADVIAYEDHFTLFMDAYRVYKYFFNKKGKPEYEFE